MATKTDVIATKKYIAKNGNEVYRYTLHLVPYGGFNYGNGKALVLNRGAGSDQCFDARYDKRFNSVESFEKNAYEFVRNNTDPAFSLKEV